MPSENPQKQELKCPHGRSKLVSYSAKYAPPPSTISGLNRKVELNNPVISVAITKLARSEGVQDLGNSSLSALFPIICSMLFFISPSFPYFLVILLSFYIPSFLDITSLQLRHIADPATSNSTLKTHWGHATRILLCANDAGSCAYLDGVYWMHDVSMLYTFIM